jgi:hypothetical protein
MSMRPEMRLITIAVATAAASAASFITRSGSQLMLDGKPFRFGGANMYWLGLDEVLHHYYVGLVEWPSGGIVIIWERL